MSGMSVRIGFCYTEGLYVVADSVFGVYGSGETPQAAFEDWGAALRGRFGVLLQDEGALAPYLVRELLSLKEYFGVR